MLLLNGSIKNLLKRRKLANYFFKWIKKKCLFICVLLGKKRAISWSFNRTIFNILIKSPGTLMIIGFQRIKN
jgi:hypothetical protein